VLRDRESEGLLMASTLQKISGLLDVLNWSRMVVYCLSLFLMQSTPPMRPEMQKSV
jgi:hypothetical protein